MQNSRTVIQYSDDIKTNTHQERIKRRVQFIGKLEANENTMGFSF